MRKTIASKVVWLLPACIIIGLLSFFPVTVHAAQVSFSDPTCVQGEQVTVSVKISQSVAGAELHLAYDPAMLTFISASGSVSGSANDKGGGRLILAYYADSGVADISIRITFRAEAVGKTTINVSDAVLTDVVTVAGDDGSEWEDVVELPVSSGNSQITITAPQTASSDASLTGLRISPGTLSPSFAPGTTSYRASVGNETTSVAVSYSCAAGASAIYYGNTDLKVGDNQLVVKVTAEDGVTTRQYVVTITRAQAAATQPAETTQPPATTQPPETTPPEESTEQPPAVLSMNTTAGDARQIGDFDESLLPIGFQKTTMPYQGADIPVAAGSGAHPLVWLLRPEASETGSEAPKPAGDFWFYDADRELAYPVSGLTGAALQLMPVMPPADTTAPAGYELHFVQIGEKTSVPVYAPVGVEGYNHYIVYAIDAAGAGGLYLYDCAQGTLQRYGFAITGETEAGTLPEETDATTESSAPVPATSASEEIPGEPEQRTLLKYIAIGVAALVVTALIALLAVLVTSAIRTRRREQEEILERETEAYLRIRPQTFERELAQEAEKDEADTEIKTNMDNFSKLFDPEETPGDK